MKKNKWWLHKRSDGPSYYATYVDVISPDGFKIEKINYWRARRMVASLNFVSGKSLEFLEKFHVDDLNSQSLEYPKY